MLNPDWELWACANEMIRQHGRQAVLRAVERSQELAREGDEAGAEAWMQIMQRIVDLLRKPVDGEPLH